MPIARSSTTQQDDAQLARRVAARDGEALEALYVRYSGPIYSLCLKMLQQPEEAEEALQDIFLRLWKKARTYDPARASFFTWLVMMTRSHCIDRLRKRKNRLVMDESQDIEERKLPVNFTEDSRTRILLNERSESIRQRLSQLPEEQRICIEMAFFQGLTHSEIAENLSEPLGTIKARIRRGMLKLRDLFSK